MCCAVFRNQADASQGRPHPRSFSQRSQEMFYITSHGMQIFYIRYTFWALSEAYSTSTLACLIGSQKQALPRRLFEKQSLRRTALLRGNTFPSGSCSYLPGKKRWRDCLKTKGSWALISLLISRFGHVSSIECKLIAVIIQRIQTQFLS